MIDSDTFSDPILLSGMKATSADPYLQATVRTIDGYGSKGAKPRPFNQLAAIRQFGSWAYKATMLNANAVARIPLRLYVKRKSTGRKLFATAKVKTRHMAYLRGDLANRRQIPCPSVRMKVAEFQGDFEEVVEPHPVIKLLISVNPWMNGFDLTQLRMIYLQLTGNAYTHVVTDPVLGVPSQLWPMPSQYVSIVPSKETLIDKYVYGVGTENEKRFTPDEVIHNRLPNPADPMFYGRGCVEAAWTALGLHGSKRVMDQAKFDNMNRPDWFIAFKQAVQPAALERFESKIDEKFRGASKAGKFLAIGSDATIQAMNEAMEEIGDADRIVEEIAAAFNVPVSMLKANDPNRVSAQTADTAWLRDAVRPLALADEEKLNEKLLPMFDVGKTHSLLYDPVSFEDETLITRNALAKLAGGATTVDETRDEIGYGPIPGGDVRYPPSGATGQASSLLGSMAPGQNSDRQNEGDGELPQPIPASEEAKPTQAPPAPVGPKPESADNAIPVGLNGAQITAALQVINQVGTGEIAPAVGLELLVAVGIDRAVAEEMINKTPVRKPSESNAPKNLTPKPIKLSDVDTLRVAAIGSESPIAWRAYTQARALYRRETLILLAVVESTESE